MTAVRKNTQKEPKPTGRNPLLKRIEMFRAENHLTHLRVGVDRAIADEFLKQAIPQPHQATLQKIMETLGQSNPNTLIEIGFEYSPVIYIDLDYNLTKEASITQKLEALRKLTHADEADLEGRTVRLWWD